MNFLRQTARTIYSTVRRVIFPAPPAVASLETMSPSNFRERVTPAREVSGNTITALFSYRDQYVREAIWELKYRGNRQITALLGRLLAEHIESDVADATPFSGRPIVLVPIAVSRERHRKRGWSQSELLTDAVYHAMTFPATRDKRTLTRHGGRPAQTQLQSRKERLRNMDHVFSVSADVTIDPTALIIVIDDVTTTGATLRDAQRALLEAGAHAVWAYAVAH